MATLANRPYAPPFIWASGILYLCFWTDDDRVHLSYTQSRAFQHQRQFDARFRGCHESFTIGKVTRNAACMHGPPAQCWHTGLLYFSLTYCAAILCIYWANWPFCGTRLHTDFRHLWAEVKVWMHFRAYLAISKLVALHRWCCHLAEHSATAWAFSDLLVFI